MNTRKTEGGPKDDGDIWRKEKFNDELHCSGKRSLNPEVKAFVFLTVFWKAVFAGYFWEGGDGEGKSVFGCFPITQISGGAIFEHHSQVGGGGFLEIFGGCKKTPSWGCWKEGRAT